MKKKKIKWGNVIKLIMFIYCMGVILHDIYMLIIKLGTFTWFGLITFILYCGFAGMLYEDFKKQTKKTQATRNSSRLEIR